MALPLTPRLIELRGADLRAKAALEDASTRAQSLVAEVQRCVDAGEKPPAALEDSLLALEAELAAASAAADKARAALAAEELAMRREQEAELEAAYKSGSNVARAVVEAGAFASVDAALAFAKQEAIGLREDAEQASAAKDVHSSLLAARAEARRLELAVPGTAAELRSLVSAAPAGTRATLTHRLLEDTLPEGFRRLATHLDETLRQVCGQHDTERARADALDASIGAAERLAKADADRFAREIEDLQASVSLACDQAGVSQLKEELQKEREARRAAVAIAAQANVASVSQQHGITALSGAAKLAAEQGAGRAVDMLPAAGMPALSPNGPLSEFVWTRETALQAIAAAGTLQAQIETLRDNLRMREALHSVMVSDARGEGREQGLRGGQVVGTDAAQFAAGKLAANREAAEQATQRALRAEVDNGALRERVSNLEAELRLAKERVTSEVTSALRLEVAEERARYQAALVSAGQETEQELEQRFLTMPREDLKLALVAARAEQARLLRAERQRGGGRRGDRGQARRGRAAGRGAGACCVGAAVLLPPGRARERERAAHADARPPRQPAGRRA